MAALASLIQCHLIYALYITQATAFSIVGYIPEWRFDGIPFHLISPHLTHLILFSLETDSNAEISELSRLPAKDKMSEIRRVTKQSSTALLISFGGYGRSNGFPEVATSNSLRHKFVRNALALVDEYALDGLDLNWEYPRGKNEWRGLFEMIQLLKGKRPSLVLTMAFYPGQESLLAKSLDLQRNIDLFLMMSYDNMRAQPGKSMHSTMQFAQDTVRSAIGSGLDPSKVALGVPFYARHMVSGDWKTYEEIVRELRDVQGVEESEIRKLDVFEDYYYNGIDTIVAKTRLALREKIGGLMIWENGQDVHDDPLSLLGAISSTLKQPTNVDEGQEDEHNEL